MTPREGTSLVKAHNMIGCSWRREIEWRYVCSSACPCIALGVVDPLARTLCFTPGIYAAS